MTPSHKRMAGQKGVAFRGGRHITSEGGEATPFVKSGLIGKASPPIGQQSLIFCLLLKITGPIRWFNSSENQTFAMI